MGKSLIPGVLSTFNLLEHLSFLINNAMVHNALFLRKGLSFIRNTTEKLESISSNDSKYKDNIVKNRNEFPSKFWALFDRILGLESKT